MHVRTALFQVEAMINEVIRERSSSPQFLELQQGQKLYGSKDSHEGRIESWLLEENQIFRMCRVKDEENLRVQMTREAQ